MKIEFLTKFNKDLTKIRDKNLLKKIEHFILELENCNKLSEIEQIKKCVGFKNAYRKRIGDYRIGFFVDGRIIELAIIASRKDIYKTFPQDF